MDIFALLPLISAISVFSIGLFVFLREKDSKIHFTFFLHALAVTVWLFGTFMMFINTGDRELAIFWDRFVYVGVVFIPAFMYHFYLSLTGKKPDFLFYLGYVLAFLFLVASRTRYFVDDLFVYRWGVHTEARFLHTVFLVYFTAYVLIWFVKTYKHYKQLKSPALKQQTKYILLAFFVLIPIGSLGYLPAYGIPIFPFAYLGGVVFTVILAYAVLKHNLFNIKIIAIEVLTLSIWVFVLIRTLLSETAQEVIVNASLLLFLVISGVLLVHNVLKEVRMREEMERLADKLQSANIKLRKLDEAKSEFISIASHQLRAPLTAIKGYSSMLLEDAFGKMPPASKTPMERILQSSVRLIDLVGDFLNLGRIETGKLECHFKKVDLRKLIGSLVDDFKTTQTKGLKIDFEVSGSDNFIVTADGNKIRQVISNLIDNAIKYTPKGFVRIHLYRKNEEKIIVLEIRDSGIGMSKDTLARIFEKFTRARAGISQFYTEGVGMGLYIAKEIMRAHGGKIWSESDGEGKGSAFYISLPIDFIPPETPVAWKDNKNEA